MTQEDRGKNAGSGGGMRRGREEGRGRRKEKLVEVELREHVRLNYR